MIFKQNEPISRHAYYKTGGEARSFYQPKSVAELSAARKDIAQEGTPYFFIGGGTNSLVSDERWNGAVISFAGLRRLDVNGEYIVVGAGIENSDLAKAALKAGLEGAAWMYRLPGQLGGTVRMNARCYGGEISEITTRVTTVAKDGEVKVYTDKSIFRGYKDTIFMQNDEAIAEIEVELAPGDKAAIEKKMLFCESDRESKGQFTYPTCGCVFKNNYAVGVPSGMLLEAAGVKDLKTEGVSINPQHANFVYNISATSRSIVEMTLKMRELVYSKFGVWLEYEMELLGAFPKDLEAKLKEERPAKWNTAEIERLKVQFAKKL